MLEKQSRAIALAEEAGEMVKLHESVRGSKREKRVKTRTKKTAIQQTRMRRLHL